jgi:hypothetical protein
VPPLGSPGVDPFRYNNVNGEWCIHDDDKQRDSFSGVVPLTHTVDLVNYKVWGEDIQN